MQNAPATQANAEQAVPGQPQQMRQADPKEQEAYRKVVLGGMKILYGDATHDKIMQMLQTKGDPATSLAATAELVVNELDAQSKDKIPRHVIAPASLEILTLVAELADKAGIIKADEQTVIQAGEKLIYNLAKTYGAKEGQQGQQQQAAPQAPATPDPAAQPPEASAQGGTLNQMMNGGA